MRILDSCVSLHFPSNLKADLKAVVTSPRHQCTLSRWCFEHLEGGSLGDWLRGADGSAANRTHIDGAPLSALESCDIALGAAAGLDLSPAVSASQEKKAPLQGPCFIET